MPTLCILCRSWSSCGRRWRLYVLRAQHASPCLMTCLSKGGVRVAYVSNANGLRDASDLSTFGLSLEPFSR